MKRLSPPVAVAAMLAAWCLVSMAAGRYDEARAATRSAQSLQATNRWADAQALLQREGESCGTDAQGKPCRLLISFSLGYLTEREAAKSYPVDAALLEQAAAHYQAVLAEAPDHVATLKNLALIYRTLGKVEEAERALKKAVELDRSGSGRAALLLGNVYRETRRPDLALAAYETAASADSAAEAPLRAIVDVFGELPPNRISALLPRLREWEVTFPGVAELGYRQVVDRALPADPALAEQAVLGWVATLARNGWISARSFEKFQPAWPVMQDLQSYLRAPESPPRAGSWWTQAAKRRSVLAEVALAVGSAPEAVADAGRAAARWEQGMRFCPRYEEYMFGELRNVRPVRLELARELIAHYAKHRALDPDERRQRELINELFAGKGGAYQASDPEVIQRFHTTLGLIYAERRMWEGSGAANGRFQIEHALGIAGQREKQDGYVQPLQELKARLAEGYEILGRSDLARGMFVKAAQAYLDTDQLDLAQTMMTRASRIAAPAAADDLQRQIAIASQIVATRRAIAEARGNDFDPASPAYAFDQRGNHRWLFESTDADSFLARQRFKATADLALRSRDAGHSAAAETHAIAAFSIATRLRAMVGTVDLIRLEKVKELATVHVAYSGRRTDVDAAAPAKAFAGKSWALYVPAEPRPLFVKVSSDAVLAGKLTAEWRKDPALSGKAISFAIDGGRVELSYQRGDGSAPTAFDKLRAVDGVRAWTAVPASQ